MCLRIAESNPQVTSKNKLLRPMGLKALKGLLEIVGERVGDARGSLTETSIC